ncbi:alpha-L-fucosidase [Streptomyces sp. NPDC007861]|uniref:alpha-L-fucosidase n=1 Tax=Streptomyces sp. NPDC007861 TaxID=3154893 RepID=UPI0033E75136
MTAQSWFAEARLGIFVHWGISSVRGVALSRSSGPGEIAYQEYMEQLGGFTAVRYSADDWADLFARAGAGYAVMTAKQHDGVALWDSAATELSVVRATPAGRDLVRPFTRALRRRGLRVGLYFSYHDPGHRPDGAVGPSRQGASADARVRRRQVQELVGNYQPDLLWFDGAGGRGQERWAAQELPGLVPALGAGTVVIRCAGGDGDYATPELGIPVVPSDGPWELCYPLGEAQVRPSGAGRPSVGELVHVFAQTIAGGGNLLLRTSPREDGTILPEHADRLAGLGRWIRRNRDAVYAMAGLPYGYFEGPSTLSRDRRTLFLFCTRAPQHLIELRGLRNAVRRISVLSTGAEVSYRVAGGLPDWNIPRVIRIRPPASPGVLAVELDGELELHQETWMSE